METVMKRFFFIILLAMVTGLMATRARGGTDTWQNGGDLLWANAANWSTGAIPSTADTASFAGANLGAVNLGGVPRTINTLDVNNAGYTFANGTLSLNAINQNNTSGYLTIGVPITDAGGNGLVINFYSASDSARPSLNLSGQITISSTATNAFSTAGAGTGKYNGARFGSTTLGNSVAGGVQIGDFGGGNSLDFNGTWTIGGDFIVNRASSGRGDVSMNTVNLMNTVAITGNLQNSTACGNSVSIAIANGSAVTVGGDLVVTTKSSNDITINGQLSSLGGSARIYNGTLKLNVTDPVGSGVNMSRMFLLGDTSGSAAAQIEIDTNTRTLNNPITVQSGSSGAATLYSGATGTGAGNKVTFAGAITMNKALNITANNGVDRILDVVGNISGAAGVAINSGNQVGTVWLSGSNSYIGGTTISGGNLVLKGTNTGAGATIVSTGTMGLSGLLGNSTVTVASGAIFTQTVTGAIAGTGNSLNNSGTTLLCGTNTYTGGTIISSGSVSFMTTNAKPASGTITVASGASIGLGVTGTDSFGQSDVDALFAGTMPNVSMVANSLVGINTLMGSWTNTTSQGGTYGLNKLGANTLFLDGVNTYSGPTVVTAGTLKLLNSTAITNNGTVTVSGGIYDLGGFTVTNGAVTMSSGAISNGTLYASSYTGLGGTLYAILAGSGALTNISGALTLTGANTYSGGTVIYGGTLTLNGNTGSLDSSGTLTFGGSGTFNFDNVGASGALSQTLGALTFNAGDGTVKITRTAAQNALLTFSSLSRSNGATGTFLISAGAASASHGFVIGGVTPNTFIDKGIFYGVSSGDSYAWYDSGSFVRALVYGTDPLTGTSGATTSLASTNHQQITGAISAQNTATFTTFKDSGNYNVTLAAGQTVTVDSILKSGNNAATISGGVGIQASSGAELVIRTDQASDSLTISTTNLANGVNALTKSGLGTLTLNSTNTYTGKTTVLGGTLILGTVGSGFKSNGIAGPLGMPTGANGTIDLYAGVTLQTGSTSPRVNQATDRTINLAGGPGTVSMKVTDNDTSFTFGGVTATGVGSKTLALAVGFNSTGGDRTIVTFNGPISDVSDGSQVSLFVSFRGQSAGDGKLYLNGVNTFSGSITTTNVLNAGGSPGTIFIGGSGSLNSGNYANTIFINQNLVFNYASSLNQVLSGVISGSGALTLSGSGTLTLSGVNTYSGGTTVSTGVLALGNDNALGSGLLTMNGGTLASDGATARMFTNNISIAANSAFGQTSGGTGALTFSGTVNLGTTTRTLTNNSATTFSGALYNTAGLTKDGAATMTLTDVSTYTGPTTVSAGTLVIGGSGQLGSGTYDGAISIANGASLTYSSSAYQTLNGVISGSGGAVTQDNGKLVLTKVNTYSGATSVNGGMLVGVTGGSCANSAVSVASGATNGVRIMATGGQWTCSSLTYGAASSAADFYFTATPSTTTAPLNISGDLTLNNTLNIIVRSGVGIPVGTYPLIKYGGTLNGTPPAAAFLMPPGMAASISNNVGSKSIDLITTVAYSLTIWRVGDGNWDINTTDNWKNEGGANTNYLDGSPVKFDDTASGSSPITVTLNTAVNPANVQVDNTNKNYIVSGSGRINAGIDSAGGLVKRGPGSLTLAVPAGLYGDTPVDGGGTLVISGAVVSNITGNLLVGTNTSFNSLIITNGGTLTNIAGIVGVSANAHSNKVTVTGAGSSWCMTNSLIVGSTGSFNSVIIAGGGLVTNTTATIGNTATSGGNTVIVTGSGSIWSNNGVLKIGAVSGSENNSLTISNGAYVSTLALNDASTIIGNGSKFNTLTVTGSGSVLTNLSTGALDVGYGNNSDSNTLIIAGGGFVYSSGRNGNPGRTALGWSTATAKGNKAIITGAGSKWNVGYGADGFVTGGAGTMLIVSNQGTLTSLGISVGHQGGDTTIIVTDPGSLWNAGQLNWNGGTGCSIIVTNGGTLAASVVQERSGGGSGMSITVTGTNSLLNSAGNLDLGNSAGKGDRLTISKGGAVISVTGNLAGGGNGGMNTSYSNNVAIVTDPGSVWTNSNLYVGVNASFNRLSITNGGRVVCTTAATMGNAAGISTNSILLTSGGILEANTITVGNAGSKDNTITNQSGILQFTTATPAITIGGGAGNMISMDGGTLSYRNITNVNMSANTLGSGVGLFTWTGANTLRLDNSAATNAGPYTIGVTGDPKNYARLEMINGVTAVTGASTRVTVDSTGSILFSNTTALICGAFTNSGTMTITNSTVTFTNGCTLADGSALNWDGTNAIVNVCGGNLVMTGNRNMIVTNVPESSLPFTIFRVVGGGTVSDSGSWTVTPSAVYGVLSTTTELQLVKAQEFTLLLIK